MGEDSAAKSDEDSVTEALHIVAMLWLKCCANCGKEEIDDIKLKDCSGGCDLARYCSDDCQQQDREIHEATCKKRVAKLRDEILFRQPESSNLGDCPICLLPLPLDLQKYTVVSCCGKLICRGCHFANQMREIKERLIPRCPFCRNPMPDTDEEHEENYKIRAAANDPITLGQIGVIKNEERDYDSAYEYLMRAAVLGNAEAHYVLSIMYLKGRGVEKDEERRIYHLEEAAIGGHPDARHNIGIYEWKKQRYDRAVKHWIIAANLGDNDSLQQLKDAYKLHYKYGLVSKDDLAAALRAYQAAIDVTKSPQREEAAFFLSTLTD